MLSQNFINIFCGPLFFIRLSACEKDIILEDECDTYIVEVFRNTELIGGESYEKMEFQDILFTENGGLMSLNAATKKSILESWLEGSCDTNDFHSHRRSVKLTADIFREIFKRRKERFG
jgi:hypothetical protein